MCVHVCSKARHFFSKQNSAIDNPISYLSRPAAKAAKRVTHSAVAWILTADDFVENLVGA
jgi:hypothetical protein